MAAYVYVNEVNPNLICCICQTPFLSPVVTNTCSHTFCRDCIERSLEEQPCCPVDRTPLSLSEIRSENLLLRNMVDELVVECTNRYAGCKHTCQRQLLASHLRDSCQYSQVPCPEDGCDKLVYRMNLGKHAHDCIHKFVNCDACDKPVEAVDLQSHISECAEQDIACPDCSIIVKRAELTEHKPHCPEAKIHCSHSENGCRWIGKRNKLYSHLSSCSYEAIKGFFAINNQHISALQQENIILKQKLEQAEATTRGLTRDLSTVRRALGPWWQLGSNSTSSNNNLSFQTDTNSTHQERSRWHSDLDVTPDNPSNSTVSPNSIPSDETRSDTYSALLASHFPHDMGGSPAASPAQLDPTSWYTNPPSQLLQPRGNFHFSHNNRFPDLQNPMPSSSLYFSPNGPSFTIPRITPLDFDAPLSGTIQTLHDDIVALSTSLDSLARRTDISLTTENLRMNEEVGALRAIVHGLRMQVHALITERNSNVWSSGGLSSLSTATATSSAMPQAYASPVNHHAVPRSTVTPPIVLPAPPGIHPPLLFNQAAQTTKL